MFGSISNIGIFRPKIVIFGSDDPVTKSIKQLKSGNPTKRAEAVENLGNLGDLSAVEHLTIVLLNDDSSLVREKTAEALGKLGSNDAVGALAQALDDPNTGVVKAALVALNVLFDREMAAEVIAKLSYLSVSRRNQEAATTLRTWQEQLSTEICAANYRTFCTEQNRPLWFMVDGNRNEEVSRIEFFRYKEDNCLIVDEEIREEVPGLLSEVQALPEGDLDRIFGVGLLSRVDDPSLTEYFTAQALDEEGTPGDRMLMQSALREAGDTEEWMEVLLGQLGSADAGVSVLANAELRSVHDKAIIPILVERLADDQLGNEIKDILLVHAEDGRVDSRELVPILRHRDPAVRGAALEVIASVHDKYAYQLVAERTGDPDEAIVEKAERSLEFRRIYYESRIIGRDWYGEYYKLPRYDNWVGGHQDPSVSDLVGYLDDENRHFRVRAMAGLSAEGGTRALRALLQELEKISVGTEGDDIVLSPVISEALVGGNFGRSEEVEILEEAFEDESLNIFVQEVIGATLTRIEEDRERVTAKIEVALAESDELTRTHRAQLQVKITELQELRDGFARANATVEQYAERIVTARQQMTQLDTQYREGTLLPRNERRWTEEAAALGSFIDYTRETSARADALSALIESLAELEALELKYEEEKASLDHRAAELWADDVIINDDYFYRWSPVFAGYRRRMVEIEDSVTLQDPALEEAEQQLVNYQRGVATYAERVGDLESILARFQLRRGKEQKGLY